MELNLTETRSRVTKTLTASAEGYALTATAVIEDGKIINLNGNVNEENASSSVDGIYFDAHLVDDKLKVNYHNIAADERVTLDIISSLVDAVVEKYE